MTTRLRVLIATLALVFLAAHLTALPKTLEDIDSINFALGVERFDVAAHRPHPPGYPVFIALAKASTTAVGVIAPGWDRDRRAAAGLAIIGVIAGALAAWIFTEFWMAIGLPALSAWLASIVALTAPLFWLTANRPLTDTPGLVAAVAVQAWLLRGLGRVRSGDATLPRDWIWAAVGAGFIIGLRSQTLWLTAPLIVWALVELVARQRARQAAAMIAAAAAGAFAWAIPLVWASGGLETYIRALGNQGSEDFSNIEMLWTTPTWDLFTVSIRRTFVDPWQERTLAHVVLALAIIGIVLLALRRRRVLALVAASFLPYLALHLAFQETITTRYGLPLLIPVAGLAVVTLTSLGARAAMFATAVVAAASLVIVQPRLHAYAEGAPVFLAFKDMHRALPAEPAPPVLHLHHQVWWGVQRLFEWYRSAWDVGAQPFPGDREWLAVVQHFRSGASTPVWFLGDLTRTDLAAFDPRATTEVRRYEFPSSLRTLIGGARLDSVTSSAIRRPGWMLGAGWALTPELAGMTERDARSNGPRTADAFVLRQSGAEQIMIGGRYLGPDNGPAALVTVTMDGTPIAEWRLTSSPRWFVQWISAPRVDTGAGPYATLQLRVAGEGGAAPPRVGFEQFDVAPAGGTIYALVDGWNEQEENPATGLQWRWSSGKSTIEVRGPARDRVLHLSGESPLKYFDRPPTVTVRAADRVLATFSPAADFTQAIPIPADALTTSPGFITIELDRTHSPGDTGSPDKRRLGLRLYSLSLK